MAELQAKWGHLSANERGALLIEKAEAIAGRRLGEMEKARGAHFVERHGAETTDDAQFLRALEGVNPTTGDFGFTSPAATRFFSNRDQLNAINRAELIYARTGDKFLAEAPIQFERIIGEGYQRGTLAYGKSTKAQVYLNSQGVANTAFPIWGE